MINILIRADSNTTLGDGHVSRCITLVKAFNADVQIHWLCHTLSSRHRHLFKDKQYSLFEPPTPVRIDESSFCRKLIKKLHINVLIYDSYSLDAKWRNELNLPTQIKVVCYDDLANRAHDVDILIDASPTRCEHDYKNLIQPHTKMLIGHKYVSIQEMKIAASEQKKADLWHIFFGAGDPKNFTASYLLLLLTTFPTIRFNVVIGNLDNVPNIKNIQQHYPNRINIFITPNSIDQSLAGCSIAIGAPGIATWERLSIKLPCLLLSTHKNQIEILKQLDQKKIIIYLGQASRFEDNLVKIEKLLKHDFQNRLRIPEIDALGTQRIRNAIMELHYG